MPNFFPRHTLELHIVEPKAFRRISFSLAEMGTSALLIALGREANGTVRAHWDDWIGMGLNALLVRGGIIMLWAALLAGSVQVARRTVGEEEEGKTAELTEQKE